MITIKIPKKGSIIYGYEGIHNIVGNSHFIGCVPSAYETYHIKSDDFFKQGPIIDRFGNKAVTQFKSSGFIDLTYLEPSLHIDTIEHLEYTEHMFNTPGGSVSYFKPKPYKAAKYDLIYDSWTPTSFSRHNFNMTQSGTWGYELNSDGSVLSVNYDSLTIQNDYPYPDKSSWTTKPYKLGVVTQDLSYFLKGFKIGKTDKPKDVGVLSSPDLYQKIVDQALVPKINNIENLKDLKELSKLVPPVMKMIKRRSIKSVADLYLWYKYSFSTTKLDIKEIFNYCVKMMESSGKEYQKITVGLTADCDQWKKHCIFHCYFQTYTGSILEKLGLSFNTTNLWDVVPFSFVLDWFVSLGDLFSYLDNKDFVSRMNMFSAYVSTTMTKTQRCTDSYLGISWDIKLKYYSREHLSALPSAEPIVSLKNPSRHIVDGAALVIAIKRKR